ncbi:9098_t:CDS:2 [Ambispora leptoticha]|uniref:9098_t:CDS:1 n=1 Tax=Ambispora leptoticha TaxID=144679 RepID=A0A9N9BZT8_9GLOM|nr:9098_t:CDS:2 [Ambispora leptoticha]
MSQYFRCLFELLENTVGVRDVNLPIKSYNNYIGSETCQKVLNPYKEIRLVKLLTDKPEFPQGYYFKWLAFNRDNPGERVLFDNHTEAVEPHIVRSNSIEALSSNLTKNRLRLFATLVEKKPVNLTELAHLLQKDYALVRRDARILEGMGLIKLEKVTKEVQNGHGSEEVTEKVGRKKFKRKEVEEYLKGEWIREFSEPIQGVKDHYNIKNWERSMTDILKA